MEIIVNTTNEFRFVPEIANNLELKDKDQFAIIVKKISSAINSSKWVSLDDDESVVIDVGKKYLCNIVRFENAPLMVVEGVKKELTPEELTNETYGELCGVIDQLALFISKIQNQDADETKK